jgi:hypothetical protein
MSFLSFLNVLYYIYGFVYVEPSLHLWDEADLVVVTDLSDMLLDSVCHYFIEDLHRCSVRRLACSSLFWMYEAILYKELDRPWILVFIPPRIPRDDCCWLNPSPVDGK